MSIGKRILRFCNENVVLISGIGIIGSVHYTWYKLQDVPHLVHPSEKKEFPLISIAKILSAKITEKFTQAQDDSPVLSPVEVAMANKEVAKK